MNQKSKISSILCALILTPQIVCSEPLPLKEGGRYHIRLSVENEKLPFYNPSKAVKVTKIYDYPWIEIEYTWVPTAAYESDKKGELKSVKPKPKIHRKLLNLNHVVTITPPKK